MIDDLESFEDALGARLIESGKLDRGSLDRARRLQADHDDRLDQILTKLGLVSEGDLAQALADQLGLALVTARDFPVSPVLEDLLPVRFLRAQGVLPLADEPDGLVLAMADPLNDYALDAVRLTTGRCPLPRVALPADVETAVSRLYGDDRSRAGEPVEEITDPAAGSIETDVERLKDLASEAPVIRLVNQTIARAVEMRASDIHIEPYESSLRVRYRIDGLLCEMEAPPARYRAAIISRIKIMAKLNIAERRLPQDGRIKLAIRGTPVDLRISVIPTMHGERVVIRVLNRDSVALDFAKLGFAGQNLDAYLRALEEPHGILLVTGPTGSGKTTTLYTSLTHLNTPEKNILTVEDPIEYQLDGIGQIQVNSKIELDFANVLRSVLRHDPDIIMIGEIRDRETAEIAVQAALTGHLVLSTVHTNDAAGTISRLLDMGIDDYLITSTLICVVAQRLVRTLCNDCRRPYVASPELVEQLRLDRYADNAEVTLYESIGCETCNGIGFFGRTTIFETLSVTEPIRRLILQHGESDRLRAVAVEQGMRSTYDDGMTKALSGVTTIDEVLRVTREV